MRCYCCTETNWFMIDKAFTLWPDRQLGICKSCGNVAYQIAAEEEAKIKAYYLKDYRKTIGPSNLETTSRKLNYFKSFIQNWLIEKEKEDKKLIVGDVGCATGYIVNWFRQRGHKATGSEWTLAMRRFAEHFYGIPVTEELEPKHKYDLITMYHTFEHMIEPDKKLERYIGMLAEDGHLLISVPEWFDVIDESGAGVVSNYQNILHKDHINVFSYKSLNRLFKRHGLIVEKEDRIVYGQTFLLRKAKPTDVLPKDEDLKESWEQVWEVMQKQKKSCDSYQQAMKEGRELLFREAIHAWNKFPDAYYQWILNSTQKKDRGRCAELIQEALKVMPDNVKIRTIRAQFLYQNEEWQGAFEDFDWLCKTKVNEEFLIFKGYCLYHLGRHKEAMASFSNAATLNPMKYYECMVWLCKCAQELPSWDEVAVTKLKEQMFQQANVKMVPQDPVFAENGNGKDKKEEAKV